ncbi:MAG: ferritin family protein [Myxococcota bacterium]|jgi:rubrerythrin|nr:ferritin family protein [Myxococcota bacterium]
MTQAYSEVELVDIAKQIERCGEAFYEQAIKHSKNPKIKALFEFLLKEEGEHAKAFEEMLASVRYAGEWRTDPNYQAYLRTVVETRVFPTPEAARKLVDDLGNEIDAIRFAISFEKDTVLFFHDLRRMVREEDVPVIERLIAEEQNHLRVLGEMLHELRAS